jgi:acyl carrier protein
MTISQQVQQELAFVCAIDPEHVRRDAWLIEYGLDSLRSMELILALENHFDIEIENEAVARLTTVGDVINLIEEHLA